MFFCLSRALTTIDVWVGKIEAFILSTAILMMATNSIANIFGRYLFSESLYFTEELNQFLIIIITFMGLGLVTRQGKHIRMSAFYDMLNINKQRILMVIISTVTAIVMLMLAWYALEYVLKIAMRGRVTPALQVPLYLTYIWVVIGFFIAAIQYTLTAFKNINTSFIGTEQVVYISFSKVDEYSDPEIEDAITRTITNNETSTNKGELK